MNFDPQAHFSPQSTYLNTATVGLPSNATMAAMQTDMARWQQGDLNPVEYDEVVGECRRLFGRLIDVPADWVSIGNQVAPFVGMLAQTLKPGARVLAADNDFTSVLFPFFVQEARGIEVVVVPLDELVERLDESFDWVALSAVQSCNGQVAELDAISLKAQSTGARILLDATHAVSWLDIKPKHWDMLVCGAYKWLMSPRGTAFCAMRPDLMDEVIPVYANWYAGEDIWQSIYGTPLRLATSARRFDISPAWLCWVGTLPALQLVDELGVANIGEHNIALANRFCCGAGLPAANSAIVSINEPGVGEKLQRAGIKASVRAGAGRLSFHLYNTEADVDRALEVIQG